MSRPRVFLTGGDGLGWALDDDLRLTRRALEGTVSFSDLDSCDIVQSMWWERLAEIPEEALLGKRVVCHVPGEPFRYLSSPRHSATAEIVGQWVTQSRQAQQELASIGVASVLIPYAVDPQVFHPVPKDHDDLVALRDRWHIPSDVYLIGNFHRDTEGRDLTSPKLVKGPDIFAEIMLALARRGQHIHVVLAGPRRFWMRRRLAEFGISYTFVGELVEGQDDISSNVLPQRALNLLYNLIDLYVVSSRSEGGPRSILEAAATRCKVISTAVGLAPDVLQPETIYSSPLDAADLIQRDAQSDCLRATLAPHYQRVVQRHQPTATAALFRDLYAEAGQIPPFAGRRRGGVTGSGAKSTRAIRTRLFTWFARRPAAELTVGLWHRFFKPPYGGGNQFMLALRKGLLAHGVAIRENQLGPEINAYILNSVQFDVPRFQQARRRHELRIVHRIDGPIQLIRGGDRESDELCFRLNAELAAATVLQSSWTYQRVVEMGYRPVNPVIIHNAVDPDIFHSRDRIPFDPGRKVRLISSSWSDNPRKGGPIYKWIEEHLDWTRFEYTFVGKASEHFQRIRRIAPVPSDELATILRQHDIYITASSNDPCSNALIEALACGLPAIYLNDGGHPELVGYGGLPFREPDEIVPRLEAIVEDYITFQNLIAVPSLDETTEKYVQAIRSVVQ